MSCQVGSGLLKAPWLLPIHISHQIHPWDISIIHRCLLAPTREGFLIPGVMREMILNQRKVSDCKQQQYYMTGRCKNYTVAICRYLYHFFFPLGCSSSGSCVYMATFIKDCMRQRAVQQRCLSNRLRLIFLDQGSVLMAESGSKHLPQSVSFCGAPSGHIQAPVGACGIA